MTEAMPFLQKYDITFLRPPRLCRGIFFSKSCLSGLDSATVSGSILYPSSRNPPWRYDKC